MKTNAGIVVAQALHRLGGGSPVGLRPAPPVLAVSLGQRAVGRELLQGRPLLLAVTVAGGIAAEARPQPVQRLHLQIEDPFAVDAPLAVQGTPLLAQARDLGVRGCCLLFTSPSP